MPEGDTIHYAAQPHPHRRWSASPIQAIETPQRRHAHGPLARAAGRPRRALRGRPREASLPPLRRRPHAALPPAHGRPLGRLPPRPALEAQPAPGLARDPHARARGGAVRRARARADDRLAHALRPAPRRARAGHPGRGASTSAAFLRRLREDDPTRGIADALLDQRNIAGIGNLWKAEACFLAGVNPWRPLAEVPDDLALEIVEGVRPLMQASAAGGGQVRDPWVFERHGRPCRRCGTLDPRARAGRRQPHHLLVSGMPGVIRVGHKGADHVAPGNTVESFEAALEHGVDMIEFDVLRTRDGRLVLAHDYEDAAGRECLTLDEGLDHFAGEAYAGVTARRGPEAARLRARGGGGARARAGWPSARWCPRCTRRASTGSASCGRACAAAGRCRACARLHPLVRWRLPAYAVVRGDAGAAARRRPRRACGRAAARRSWCTACS